MKLVYHIFVPKGGLNLIHKIHFACLNEYSYRFNSALFVISIDNTEDHETITSVEYEIVKCGFRDLRFKVIKNDPNKREAETLKTEIFDNIMKSPSNELTFFGHTHGAYRNGDNLLSQAYWVSSMYYFLLDGDYYNRCVNNTVGNYCYGPFLFSSEKLQSLEYYPKNCWWYHGSFYVLNEYNIKRYIEKNKFNLDNIAFCKTYSELVLGSLFELKDAGSMMKVREDHIHLENFFTAILKELVPREEYNAFFNWFNTFKLKYGFEFPLYYYGNEYKTVNGNVFMFSNVYEHYISNFKGKNPNIAVIGVDDCEMVNMLNEYFNHCCFIFGIDKEAKYSHMGNYITININPEFDDHLNWLNALFVNYKNRRFDIVIDGGNYGRNEQLNMVNFFHDKMSKNGIYIIENIHDTTVVSELYSSLNQSIKDLVTCINNTPYYNNGNYISAAITFKNDE